MPSNCQSPLTEPDVAESAFGASGARFGCAGGATRKGLGVDNGGIKPFGVVRSVEVEVNISVRDGVVVSDWLLVVGDEVVVRVAVKDDVGVAAFVEATVRDEVSVAVAEEVTVDVIGVAVVEGATVEVA